MAVTAMYTLLEQTIVELNRFLIVLSNERKILVSAETGQLPTLTEEKSALATRLATLELQRKDQLRNAGFTTDRAGMEVFFSAQPDNLIHAQTQSLWGKLLILTAKVKQENDLNGTLISARLQQNQQALNSLLGELADANTYDAEGQQKSVAGRRPLGSA